MAKQLTSPYGNSPQDLPSQVPGQDLGQNIAKFMAAQTPPKVETPTPSMGGGGGGLGAEIAAFAAQQQQPAASAIDQTVDQSMAGLQQLAGSFGEQTPSVAPSAGGADLITQFRASFAGNDQEKMGFLQKIYGQNNVQYEDGKFKFSTDGGRTFKPFNSKVFGNFLDNFIPSGRDVVKELAMVPGELAGGAAGTFVAPGAGTLVGGAAGRVASVPASNAIADEVAQWMGIPLDTSRDKSMENGIEMAIEGALPVVGAIAKRGIIKPIASRIPGTRSFAEKKTLQAAEDVFQLDDASKQVVKDLEDLKAAGLNPELLNNQIHTQSAPLQTAASQIAGKKEFQDAQVKVANSIRDVVQQTASRIYDEKLAARAGDGRIGSVVTSAAQDLQKAEGKAIGTYKARAMANLKNQPIPLSADLRGTMRELGEKLGFTIQSVGDKLKVVPPKGGIKLGTMGITEAGQARAVLNTFQDLANASNAGQQLRLSDVERLTNVVGNMNKTASKVGGELYSTWGRMSSQLREFRRQAIESGLTSDTDKAAFNEAMNKFGAVKSGVDNIINTINDDMGSHIVVDKLLSKGKEGFGDAQSLKYILKESEPAAWEKLKGDWITRQMELHAGPQATGLNAGALLKDIKNKYGKEFMDLMFDDPKQADQFMASLRLAERVNKTTVKPGKVETGEAQKIVSEAATSLLGSVFLKARAAVRMFGIGKDADEKNALMKVLSQDGYAQYIKGLPPKQRDIVTKKFDELIDYSIKHNFIKPQTASNIKRRTGQAAGLGQDYVGRLIMQNTRTGASGIANEPLNTPMETEQ